MNKESKRLPKTLWRVLAVGGKRAYWEGASKTFSSREQALMKVDYYRRGGADVLVYRADINWIDVTEEVCQ